MENILDLTFNTDDGIATINEIYISELGFLMVKLFFHEKKIYKGYNITNIIKFLKNKNIIIDNDLSEKVNILNNDN